MRNILIVVDMQKDFVTGALASAEAQAILPEVMAKISEYDRAGKEIIFTRDTHGEDYMQTNEGKHLPVPHCINGTDGWQICAELTDGITSEYKTVDKPTFGFLGWKEVLASETADGLSGSHGARGCRLLCRRDTGSTCGSTCNDALLSGGGNIKKSKYILNHRKNMIKFHENL